MCSLVQTIQSQRHMWFWQSFFYCSTLNLEDILSCKSLTEGTGLCKCGSLAESFQKYCSHSNPCSHKPPRIVVPVRPWILEAGIKFLSPQLTKEKKFMRTGTSRIKISNKKKRENKSRWFRHGLGDSQNLEAVQVAYQRRDLACETQKWEVPAIVTQASSSRSWERTTSKHQKREWEY